MSTSDSTCMSPSAISRARRSCATCPSTAAISKRCVRMMHCLFHGEGEPDAPGTACAGSSEAVMLGALAMKWRWKAARKAAGKPIDRPNLVYGADVHVVWDKFCRYFEVEPRQVALRPGRYTVGPEELGPQIDENTIGVVAVVGTTFTGDCDDVAGIDAMLRELAGRGLDVPLHIDAASGGFVFPFSAPSFEWDFRLASVKSINVSGHKFGLVYPGVGWLVFRDERQLPEELVFYEDYLGERDATFTLNFSGSSAFILAQYYNFVRRGCRWSSRASATTRPSRARISSASSPSAAAGWCPPTSCPRPTTTSTSSACSSRSTSRGSLSTRSPTTSTPRSPTCASAAPATRSASRSTAGTGLELGAARGRSLIQRAARPGAPATRSWRARLRACPSASGARPWTGAGGGCWGARGGLGGHAAAQGGLQSQELAAQGGSPVAIATRSPRAELVPLRLGATSGPGPPRCPPVRKSLGRP